MKADIENMVSQFESGRMSRRQLVGRLTALVAMVAGGADVLRAGQTKSPSTFETTALHHSALKVPDLDRSQKFYEQHLGLKAIQAPGMPPFMRLLTCQSQADCWPKTHLLNLWKAERWWVSFKSGTGILPVNHAQDARATSNWPTTI